MAETLITKQAWGRMVVTTGAQAQEFKDCQVWPGGAREWNWQETGTNHSPGIQPADLQAVLAHDPEVLVLGCGVFGRLGVCAETEDLLRARQIPYHIARTPRAVELFNDLAGQGRRVGGLFHSTC